jgi:hypothetical protein
MTSHAHDPAASTAHPVVRCQQLRVGQVLGIRQGEGFSVSDLSPGVTLVLAPNGTGKTTMARAITLLALGGGKDAWRQIVGGGTAADSTHRRLDLAATFEVAGRTGGAEPIDWTISVFGGEVDEHLGGDEHRSPPPDLALASRYLISLPDLLVDEGVGFGRQILEQASGGVRWTDLWQALGWSESPSRPQSLLNRRKAARHALCEATKAQAALDKRAETLPELRRERDALRARIQRGSVLTRAQDGRKLQARLAELRQRLGGFEQSVRGLTGTERSDAQQLASVVKSATEDLKGCESDLEAMEMAAPPALSEQEQRARLDEIEGLVSSLEAQQSGLREAKDEHAAANAQLQEAACRLSALGAESPTATPGDVPVESILNAGTDVSRAAWELGARSAAVNELRRNVAALSDRFAGVQGIDCSSAEDVNDALGLLSHWLRQRRPEDSPAQPSVPTAVIVALILIGLAVAASLVSALAGSALAIASVAFSAVALVILVYWSIGRRFARRPAPAQTVDPSREDYERLTRMATGVPMPSSWTVESVLEAHARLAKTAVMLERQLLLKDVLLELEHSEVSLATAEDALAKAKTKLEQLLGRNTIGVDAVWASATAALCTDWLRARQRVMGSAAVLRSAESGLASASASARAALIDAGCIERSNESGFGAELARSLFDGLKARIDARANYERNQCKPAHAKVESARSRLSEAQSAYEMFLSGIPGGPYTAESLHQVLDDWDRYHEVARELSSRQRSWEEHQENGSEPEDVQIMSDAELAEEIKAIPGLDPRRDELDEKIAEIVQAMATASRGSSVSNALADLAGANLDLRNREISDLDVVIGQAVFSWARREAQTAMAPQVLRRARELAARFTSGRLTFEVSAPDGQGEAEFTARNASEPWRPISQLSSGERVQLLLSVRLAFLEEGESMRLPILLDEVLASSDDERASRVMDAVVDIARTGRQVLYLSSQSDEIEKWIAKMQHSGVPFEVVRLAEIRQITASDGRADRRPLPAARVLPSPNGCTRDEYATSLGVSGIDWMDDGLDSLHLWYVMPDLHGLHRQLSAGVESLGQLERLASHSDSESVRAALDQSRARATAFRAAASAWRVGRGNRVGVEVLDECDAISGVFRQRVGECLRQANGDARAFLGLVGALRGFRKDSLAELEAWLFERGHLVEAERLIPTAIREVIGLAAREAGVAEGDLGAIVDEVMAQLPA